jgi:hypothetical protein
MHWDSKILLNCSPLERPPLLSDQISDALRYQNTTKLLSSRDHPSYLARFQMQLELWVTSLSDTPHLQYYDVQTLEYRYISKLPMKNERIWSYVKETTSHL